jgi:RluA family pseudouridine synthase
VAQIEILYEDDALFVVNKPAGITSIPDGFRPDDPDLVSILEPELGRLWVVHRLDKETSGAMVFARDDDTHRALNEQFEDRDVSKTYHALVVGSPDWAERTVNAPLRVNADRHHRTLVDHDIGKPAVTHFRVLEKLRRFTLLEAQPETGRTHQIRAHCKFLGLPILCDGVYGDSKPLLLSEIKRGYRSSAHEERPLLARLALHAFQLEVTHPQTQKRMTFEAPYPKDLRAAVNQLAKLAHGPR